MAEVGRAVGEQLLATDDMTQALAVIFSLENVEHELRSPVAVAQVLLAVATLDCHRSTLCRALRLVSWR